MDNLLNALRNGEETSFWVEDLEKYIVISSMEDYYMLVDTKNEGKLLNIIHADAAGLLGPKFNSDFIMSCYGMPMTNKRLDAINKIWTKYGVFWKLIYHRLTNEDNNDSEDTVMVLDNGVSVCMETGWSWLTDDGCDFPKDYTNK